MLLSDITSQYIPYGEIKTWNKLMLAFHENPTELFIIEQLVEELKTYESFREPLTLSEEHKIVLDGVHRVLAATIYGLVSLPTVYAEEEEEDQDSLHEHNIEALVTVEILTQPSLRKKTANLLVKTCKSLKIDNNFWATCHVAAIMDNNVELYYKYPHTDYVSKVETRIRERLSISGLGSQTLLMGTEILSV